MNPSINAVRMHFQMLGNSTGSIDHQNIEEGTTTKLWYDFNDANQVKIEVETTTNFNKTVYTLKSESHYNSFQATAKGAQYYSAANLFELFGN
jgi:hypothetical protein